MFSKKTSLPARPSIPSLDEIIEDLRNLEPDDTFFKGGANQESEPEPVSPFEILKLVTKEDLDSPNKAYEKVKAFIDVYRTLDDQLVHIENERENLKSMGEGLLVQVQGVKVALEEQEPQKHS